MSQIIWLLIGNTVLFTSLGVLSTLRIGDTRWPFIYGFFSILPATALLAWFGEGAEWRRVLITCLVAIYVIRMLYTLLVWFGATGASKLKDQVPKATLLVLPLVLVPTFSWLYPLPFFIAMERIGSVDVFDVVAIAFYVVGTIFHFGSDLQKWRFRQDPTNKGKLLNVGFWGMSRHPNYFGDFLIFCAFAIFSVWPWGLISPLANLVQYFFDAIPKNEKSSQKRYKELWTYYSKATPVFLPLARRAGPKR